MLKLVIEEEGSDETLALVRSLQASGEAPSTCWLGEAEFRRAGLRLSIGTDAIELVLSDFDCFELTLSLYEQAARFPIRELRTLDAMHIAVALRASSDHFVTFDRRQAAAAAALGLNVVTP